MDGYVEADLAMKERALAAIAPPETRRPRYRPTDTLLKCQSKAVMSPLSHSKMSPFTYKEGAGGGGAYFDESKRD